MFKLGIYDLFGSKRYTYCELDESREYLVNTTLTEFLKSLLVNNKVNDNSKPYLLDDKYVELDYSTFKKLINSNLDQEKSINTIISLDKMLMLLLKSKFSKNLSNNISNYFEFQKGLLKRKFIEKNVIDSKVRILEDEVIIPVLDNLRVDSQEFLLSKFGNRSNTTLLWRSIAVCLGSSDIINQYNLKDKDSILVVDSMSNEILITKLDMCEDKGRLIPCHKNYIDSYNNLNNEYYQKYERDNLEKYSIQDKYEENYKNIKYKNIPYKNGVGLWDLKEIDDKLFNNRIGFIKLEHKKNVKLILVIADNLKINYKENIVEYCNINTIKEGVIDFEKKIKKGEIAYYDQCEGLHIVTQNKNTQYDADLQFSTLIEENGKVTGGKEIIGKTNKDLFIKKGENSVKFYLRIGNQDKNGELKVLEQIFGDYKLTERCNLILKPKMKPGQGRAIVDIECETYQEKKPFEKVNLDWNKLLNTKDTINSLLAERPLSYPPPIGRVKANTGLTNKTRAQLESYLESNNYPDLNKPKWPKKYLKTVDRFQRENIFGNEPNNRLPAILGSDGKLVKTFLIKLNEEYFSRKSHKDNVLKAIAWTYQGKSQGYFNEIIDIMLNQLETKKMDAVDASFFTNMIEDNRDLIKVFKACHNKIRFSYKGITNYLRCLYQILMYYEFIYLKSIKDNDCILLMKNLSNIYVQFVDNKVTSKYALLSILFLLKRRKIYPEFCRKGNNDGLYFHVVTALNTKSIHYDNEKLCVVIKRFLDGDGSIEGIPLE